MQRAERAAGGALSADGAADAGSVGVLRADSTVGGALGADSTAGGALGADGAADASCIMAKKFDP